MVNADATNKWYNESEIKLDHIISAIGIICICWLKQNCRGQLC
jgi:hypothetical protein